MKFSIAEFYKKSLSHVSSKLGKINRGDGDLGDRYNVCSVLYVYAKSMWFVGSCWLSIYESVVWSLIGPVCVVVVLNLGVLVFSVRAAFTLKDHVMGFGNLR
jgi:hypothetical protein